MDKENFNPNLVSVPNGNYFALPYTLEESRLVLISVPWDLTVSYKQGTSKAPDAIIVASEQLDLYDIDFGNIYQQGIGTIPFNDAILERSSTMRPSAEKVIAYLSNGGNISDTMISRSLKKVNEASCDVNEYVYNTVIPYVEQGKLVGLVGGDHSSPHGLIQALAKHHSSFGILHIDAHADLREEYEGFTYSHASIMYNVINEFSQVSKLLQVGIRDFCEDEFNLINSDPRIETIFDANLMQMLFTGKTWDQITDIIVDKLPSKIYISFDVDGLHGSYCPNTGTPVAGGLTYWQAEYLITKLAKSNKQIIGFDISEVGYSDTTDWDANVGARLLYKLSCASLYNNK